MTTTFPTALDSYTTKVDAVDDVLASHVNDIQDALVAIETKIGLTADVKISGDEAGLKQRLVDSYYTSITDHFDGSTFTGYTWASYSAAFVTPNSIEMSTYPSIARIWHNAAKRFFGYKTYSSATITAKCFAGALQYGGIRVDDGTNNKYAELFFYDDGSTLLTRIGYRYDIGAGAVGPTLLVDNIVPNLYTLQMLVSGTNVFLYYGTDLPTPKFVGTVAFGGGGFTPARSGIVGENTAATPNNGQSILIDWIKQ